MQNRPLENTVGKGEVAHNEQLLLFPQCFLTVWRTFCHFYQIQNCRLQTFSFWKSQNLLFGKVLTGVWVYRQVTNNTKFWPMSARHDCAGWHGLIFFTHILTLSQTSSGSLHDCSTSLLKTLWEKGEIACNKQFHLLPLCFLHLVENFPPFACNSKLSSANSLV